MATENTLDLDTRSQTGTAACRRLRSSGIIPGNVYGQKAEPVAVSVAEESLRALLVRGVRVIDVVVDGTEQKVMFRDVQRDTFGIAIQHFDLMRIDKDQRVDVDVPLELKGMAPGAAAGTGQLEQLLHTVSVDCLAVEIPDKLEVRIGHLEIGDTVFVHELELPDNLNVLTPPESTIVRVVEIREIEEEEIAEEGDVEAGQIEPDVIGRDEEDEQDSDSDDEA